MTRQSDADREALIAADPTAAEIMRFITDDVPSAMRLFPDMWALMLADRLRQAGLLDVSIYETEEHTVQGGADVYTAVVHEVPHDPCATTPLPTYCGQTPQQLAIGLRTEVNCTACLTAIRDERAAPFRQ